MYQCYTEPSLTRCVQIVKQSGEDKVLVIGAAITLDSAMKAHSSLLEKGNVDINELV